MRGLLRILRAVALIACVLISLTALAFMLKPDSPWLYSTDIETPLLNLELMAYNGKCAFAWHPDGDHWDLRLRNVPTSIVAVPYLLRSKPERKQVVCRLDPPWEREFFGLGICRHLRGGYITAPAAYFLVATFPPLIWGIRRARSKSPTPGLCPNCRYDLRAHLPGDRCPEYGTPVSSFPPSDIPI